MEFEALIVRLFQILLTPVRHNEVVWLIAPLLFGLVLINMYFGKYKTESLGWNTAFSNSMSLMWVSMLLLKYLSDTYGIAQAYTTPGLFGQFVLVNFIIGLTLLLGYINYTHSLPKQFAWFLSSAVPTTILAYLGIVIVYGNVPVDEYTVLAGLIIYLVVDVILRVYRKSITSPAYVEHALEEKKKKQQKEIRKVKRKIEKTVEQVLPGK